MFLCLVGVSVFNACIQGFGRQCMVCAKQSYWTTEMDSHRMKSSVAMYSFTQFWLKDQSKIELGDAVIFQ